MENTLMPVLLLTIFFAVILPGINKKPRVVAGAVICFALITGCNYAQTGQNNQATDNQVIENQANNGQINVVPAKVISVVDGDTVGVRMGQAEERVRLIGVDTPETKHPTRSVGAYGPEASSFTKSELNGKSVFLEFDVSERDKYGRMLAYVWLEKPLLGSNSEIRSKMFNAVLLLNGYAQLMTVPPNVKYVDYFKDLQAQARKDGNGLWGLTGAGSLGGKYIGSKKSDKYHYPDCEWAKKILPENVIWFKDVSDANAHGYKPCGICRPE